MAKNELWICKNTCKETKCEQLHFDGTYISSANKLNKMRYHFLKNINNIQEHTENRKTQANTDKLQVILVEVSREHVVELSLLL